MRIGLGCDHGGYELKEEIRTRLIQAGYDVVDKGISQLEEVDYPDVAQDVAEGVKRGEFACGILICGTGIGMNIAANKIPGIRAALLTDSFSAKMSKEHNNANIITLGERTIGKELAWELVQIYLNTSFSGGKHQTRIEKIAAIEESRM